MPFPCFLLRRRSTHRAKEQDRERGAGAPHSSGSMGVTSAADVTFPADYVQSAADAVKQHGFAVLKQEASNADVEKLLHRSKALTQALEPSKAPPLSDPSSKPRFFASSQTVDAFTDAHAGGIEKVGHALHEDASDCFAQFSRRARIKALLNAIGHTGGSSPVQSLILCKQPNGGSAVPPHMDATFLLSEPSSVIALWWALEDATVTNGCLRILPGSHTRSDGVPPKRLKRDRQTDELKMEGEAPADMVNEEEYVPVEVDAGDCVIMHGEVWHSSSPNNSEQSRFAYTVHYVDAKTSWRDDNWLQRDGSKPFQPL